MASLSRRWAILLGCSLVSIGVNAYFLAPASVVPLVVSAYDVSRVGAGSAISAAILGSVLIQLPGGFLLDRFDNRRLMVPGVVAFAAAVLVGTLAPGYPTVLATRLVAGMAGGFVYTLGANVVVRVFPPDGQGLATGVYVTSGPIGFALAQATSPTIAGATSLDAVFLFHVVVVAAGYLVFRLAATEPVRSQGRPSVQSVLRAFRNRRVVLLSLSAFCANALYLFLNSWMPTYATEVLSIPLAEAGVVTALVPLVGVLARPGGGLVSDYIGRRPVIVGSLLVALFLLLLIPRSGVASTYGFLLVVAGFAIQLSVGVYYVHTRELAEAGVEGTSLTVLVMVSFTGSLSAPIVGGLLVETVSWWFAFGTFAAVGVVGIVFVALLQWTASRNPDA